jgi:hypothetical protein
MKTIKSLSLLLLLAAPHVGAMQFTVASITQDINEVEESQNPAETARIKKIIADQHDMPVYYLHAAIAARKLKAAEAFIDTKISVAKDKKGNYPLDYALEDNFTAGVTLLLKNNINALNPTTLTSCSLDTLNSFYKEKKQTTPPESAPTEWMRINTAVINSECSKRIQPLIDNDLVYVPQARAGNNYYTEDSVSKCHTDALKTLILLSSQSKVSIPEPLRQKAQHHIINFYAHHYAHNDSNSNASQLKNLLSNYKMPIENKDMMFGAYRKSLYRLNLHETRDDSDTILNTLKKESPVDLAAEWDSALKLLDAKQTDANKQSENLNHFKDRAYVIFKLNPDMVVDQKTANKIHDALKDSYGSTSDAILGHVYDFTSDDRNPWRKYDPFYYVRQHARQQNASNGAYVAVPTSEAGAQLHEIAQQKKEKKSSLYPSLDDKQ